MKNVLIGGPISHHHAYCWNSFVTGIHGIQGDYTLCFVDNSKDDTFFQKASHDVPIIRCPYHPNVKKRLADSRNIVRKKVLDEGYEWLFCVDQDVVCPPDVLQRMLSHHAPIVTGVYFNPFTKKGKDGLVETRVKPVLWVYSRKYRGMLDFVKTDIARSGRLITVNSCGTGCILIHRSVLEKITFRYENDKDGVDDVFFCIDVQQLGYRIVADTSVQCEHLIDHRPQQWGEGDLRV